MFTMKQCPECSAQYDDNRNFCTKDGRSLHEVSAVSSRLCPNCANSIAEDAAHCPYCKAEVDTAPSPEWLIRDERSRETQPPRREKTTMPKIMLIAGIVLCIIAAALLGTGVLGKDESADTRRLLAEKVQELQVKEEHVKAVEAELAKVREEAAESVKEAEALKARLQESRKEQAAAGQRLSGGNREPERRSARQAQVEPRSEPRPVERTPAPSRPARRPAEPGVYETTRATEVHEQPVESSRVISRIGKGTRINVVRSDGDWLEVMSRRGNPPGFILRDDTMYVAQSN
jgi:hypothetical protein